MQFYTVSMLKQSLCLALVINLIVLNFYFIINKLSFTLLHMNIISFVIAILMQKLW